MTKVLRWSIERLRWLMVLNCLNGSLLQLDLNKQPLVEVGKVNAEFPGPVLASEHRVPGCGYGCQSLPSIRQSCRRAWPACQDPVCPFLPPRRWLILSHQNRTMGR